MSLLNPVHAGKTIEFSYQHADGSKKVIHADDVSFTQQHIVFTKHDPHGATVIVWAEKAVNVENLTSEVVDTARSN